MDGGDPRVVVDDTDRLGDVLDESPATSTVPAVGELDTDEKLGDRDGRDGDVVVVVDRVVEAGATPIGVD